MMHEKPKGIKTAGNTRISSNALTELRDRCGDSNGCLKKTVTAWIS